MAKPPITVKCECGEKRDLAYGERWTCETCGRYVKSIDLTLDARPIPQVDDLVSLSMDLWAAEEGYTRIEPGMAGI